MIRMEKHQRPGKSTGWDESRGAKDSSSPASPALPDRSAGSGESTFPWKVAGAGILALLLIWFVLQNSHSVRFNFLWWSGRYPMVVLLALVAFGSVLAWEGFTHLRQRRIRRAARRREADSK